MNRLQQFVEQGAHGEKSDRVAYALQVSWAGSPICSSATNGSLHDRDGVIGFPHRRKISSFLIRNTVVPIAIRTALGSCLAIESDHRQPGSVMSNIPLDVQRRCERRWAAQFSRRTESPRNQRPERHTQEIAESDTEQKQNPPASAGFASAT
jgi:hypothetical protein